MIGLNLIALGGEIELRMALWLIEKFPFLLVGLE